MDLDEYTYDNNIRYPIFSDVADESMFLPDYMQCGTGKPIAAAVGVPNVRAMRGTCDWKPKPNPWAGKPIASAIEPGSNENMIVSPALQRPRRTFECDAVTRQWRRAGDPYHSFGSSEYFDVSSMVEPLQAAVTNMMFMLLIILVGVSIFLAFGITSLRRELSALRRILKQNTG